MIILYIVLTSEKFCAKTVLEVIRNGKWWYNMGISDHIIVNADHPSCTAFELMISWIWKLCCLMNSAWTTNSAYVWWLLMNRYCLTRPLHEGEEIISNDIIDISWRLLHLNPGFCLWMTTHEPEPYKPDSLIERWRCEIKWYEEYNSWWQLHKPRIFPVDEWPEENDHQWVDDSYDCTWNLPDEYSVDDD